MFKPKFKSGDYIQYIQNPCRVYKIHMTYGWADMDIISVGENYSGKGYRGPLSLSQSYAKKNYRLITKERGRVYEALAKI